MVNLFHHTSTKLSSSIRGIERWSIVRTAHLAFFSFTKLRMYEDLDPAAWPEENSLEKNELIQAILEGTDRGDDIPRYGEVEVNDEHETAHEIPLVTDADSSQHTAILRVIEGKHTVIEGPPGTGKSQTITNIIATAIAAGKTVLFVSEKQAALNVVWSNLNKIGLGDFCLELHSNKSRKDEVHKSIEQRIKKRFASPADLTSVKAEWKANQKQLLEYARLCSATSGPKEEPLYSYFGESVAYREQKLPSLRSVYRDVPTDKDKFQKTKDFLARFASHLHNPHIFLDHPWKGFLPTNVLPGDEPDVLGLFEQVAQQVSAMGAIEEGLINFSGINQPLPLSLVQSHQEGLLNQIFQSISEVNPALVSKFRDPSAEKIVRKAIQNRDQHNEARRSALIVLTELTTDNPEYLEWVLGSAAELESKSCLSFRLEQLTAWLPHLTELGGILSDFLKHVKTLSKIGMGTVRLVAEIRRMIPIINVCASAPSDAARGLVPSLTYPGVLEALREARIEAENLKETRTAPRGILHGRSSR